MLDKDFPYIDFNSDALQMVTSGRCTRCPICGKVICVTDITSYTYKLINKYGRQRITCSWTCYRKAEALKQTKPNGRRLRDQYNDMD